ncbi:MAG: phosphohistidine phosphatase SixA [Gemmataceae bacterium]|nr:phosphohistidine phosphatase SixA [Gemmataceae bacterium]
MDLYLIRHADALPLGEGGVIEDSQRPLSETGRVQSRAVANALKRVGIRVESMLTSPAVRARQTADEILTQWTESPPVLTECADLAIDGNRRKLAKVVNATGSKSVALVGHQPDLCELAAWLIGSRRAQLDVAKAGVVYIQCHDEASKGCGTLVWLVTPAWYG